MSICTMINRARHDERGVVSLFIVLFAALLMSIITVSFIGIMLKDQQQSTANDLSQSAYDSAMAGVEDAKRAITLCAGNPAATNCDEINDDRCDILDRINIATPSTGANQEFQLQQGEGDNTLDQAYTCVTINTSPEDYQTDISQDQPLLIPLQGETTVDKIRLSWSPQSGENMTDFPLPNGGLLTLNSWNVTEKYPPMMRAQLIRLGTNGQVDLASLDGNQVRTKFLYPVQSSGSPSTVDFASDIRQNAKGQPNPVQCTPTVCTVTLTNGSDQMSNAGQANGFLLLTPLYGDVSATLQLQNATSQPVNFQGTQAVVDSTGRANDIFRRVSARIDLIPRPTYPNAALSLTGPLCKNFTVTNAPLNLTCP